LLSIFQDFRAELSQRYHSSHRKLLEGLIQLRDASKQLNGSIHVASVTHIDKSVSLRDDSALLDLHFRLDIDLTSDFEFFA
jgi:hypothetical protein